MMPQAKKPLVRDGVELGMRFTPLDSVGLHIPGGKAAYPSSLIHLAVPAQVAGVKKIVACSPPSKFGGSDLVLATYLELGLTEVFRAGGAAAVAAMAFGTATIPASTKLSAREMSTCSSPSARWPVVSASTDSSAPVKFSSSPTKPAGRISSPPI